MRTAWGGRADRKTPASLLGPMIALLGAMTDATCRIVPRLDKILRTFRGVFLAIGVLVATIGSPEAPARRAIAKHGFVLFKPQTKLLRGVALDPRIAALLATTGFVPVLRILQLCTRRLKRSHDLELRRIRVVFLVACNQNHVERTSEKMQEEV